MATPIVELVTADLVAALSAVSTEADYGVTLLVKEPDHVADALADGTCFVHEADWSYEDNPPLGKDGIYQNYEIHVHVFGGSERNYQRLARVYANEVKRAAMLDETRGQNARWSKVTGVRKFSDGGTRGVIVDYQVYFWTTKDHPDVP